MVNDDRQTGRILTRREALAVLGVAGAAALARCAPAGRVTAAPTSGATGDSAAALEPTAAATMSLPACVVRPELAEGPYFVDEMLNRSDIRSDPSDGSVKDGALVDLTVRVSRVDGSGCAPLQGAQVDVWHCDAMGVYSGVSDPGFNTQGQTFLRGYQLTDRNGSAVFTTIYPGWYPGRAVHIHFKIRTDPGSAAGYEFTSQWFFDDLLSDAVYSLAPYAARGERTLRNDGDRIYQESGGQTLLSVRPRGDGYAAVFDIGLQID